MKALERYIDSTEQLVTEIFVRDIEKSVEFYRRLGFELLRDDGDFVELTWEDHHLYLDEPGGLGPVPESPQANVRVMVPDVDTYWELAREIGARVVRPIADQYYGLRDFTIADPDGFGVRFGTNLTDREQGQA